ncbi:aminoacyl-tRNA hydrolase [PVC group bacterium (ex Bugula neritina AB1)]|nr:aminoacyl-tRNA hydrolase [PVC group bacterium (ex Bugula neritina AB1)]
MKKKAIVLLGNKGKKYEYTRHNFGWLVGDLLSEKMDLFFRNEYTYSFAEKRIDEGFIYIVKPMTFMNLSGQPLKLFVKHKKIELENILVICDDVDLDFGRMKMRPFGGTGGHNGLASIVREVGTNQFPRLRLGIGRGKYGMVDHVLGTFSKPEKELLPSLLSKATDAIRDFFILDWQELMLKYNTKVSV